jgi:hypothetical protein
MSENLKLIMAALEKIIFREVLETVRVNQGNYYVMHVRAFWNVSISKKKMHLLTL